MIESKDIKFSPDFDFSQISQDDIKAEAQTLASREPEPETRLLMPNMDGDIHGTSIIAWMIKWIDTQYEVKVNTVTKKVEYRARGTTKPFKPVNENTFYIQMKSIQKVSLQDIKAILGSEVIPAYDPFKNYFESLPTPIPGTIEKFCSYVKTTDPERFIIQFTKWLVRVIACALEPNSFNKQILTFVSPKQGNGKSSFLRYLCPDELKDYYTESLSYDKDGQVALTQNLLINQDELAAFNRHDINVFKSFVSRDRVSVRHPYASKQTTDPRRASFMASTNDTQFLSDPTGSVRWLIFEILEIKHKGISSNDHYQQIPINQVWAEAYSLYKDPNFRREMDGNEISENEIQNEKYRITKPEYEYVLKHCHPTTDNTDFFTATEIRDKIYQITNNTCGNLSITHIGQALNKMNYKRSCERRNGSPIWGYRVSVS